MGVRLLGVWLFCVAAMDLEGLLFGVFVVVACGSFEAGLRSNARDFCGVLADGSGRLGSSGSIGRSGAGEEAAVIQLSSLDLLGVSAAGVGCYSGELVHVNKPKIGRKQSQDAHTFCRRAERRAILAVSVGKL